MSKGRISANKAGIIGIIIAVVIVPAFVIISTNINWNEVYEAAGLSSNSRIESSEGVSVHFIDVGQGDCALIITPDNNILIDSGERDYYNIVLNYLRVQNVQKLDYIIATHPHSDHIGSMSGVINEFGAERIIMPDVKDELVPVTASFIKLLESIEAGAVEVIWAQAGMSFDLGGGAKLEILAPVRDYNELNNYSIVSRFLYEGSSFLFTGDIEETAEHDIIDSGEDLNADVLHVSHHGSRTSSTARFLNAVSGSYAVISVGSPNSYNHPNDAVVSRILNRNYEILRTDLHGNIVFDCTKEGFEVYYAHN